MKDILRKHLLTILCAISLIVLALPLAKVVSSVDIAGYGGASEVKVSGFGALKSSFFSYFLLLGPILLVAMNYVQPLEKYKGILAITVPIVCLVSLIIVVLTAASASGSGGNEYMSVDVKTKVGIGAVLAGLSYIGTIVAGAVEYHNFTLDSVNLANIKESGAALLSTAQEKVSGAVQSVSQNIADGYAHLEGATKFSSDASSTEPSGATPREPSAKPMPRKSTNLNRAEEILKIIERLAEMRNNGILTEEEYTAKKQQLLEEI